MKKGRKVIIATHGELAKGMMSALNIIVGEMPDVQCVCGYLDPDFDLEQVVTQIMEEHDFETNDLIICTDMMGGSINNGFVKYLGKYPFHLITNTNLAFLVDLLVSQTDTTEAILNSKVSEDLVAVKYVNALVQTFTDSLDDSL